MKRPRRGNQTASPTARTSRTLTPDDLAARWAGRVSRRTLDNWRSSGRGPAFEKSGWQIRYRLEDVKAYETQNRMRRSPAPKDPAQ